MLTPGLEMTQRYCERLDPKGIFTFQTFDDDKDRKDFRLAKVYHGTLEQHANDLTRLNQAGAGIFVMINRGDGAVHEGKKTCRTKANVVAVRALFADADGVPIEPILRKSPPPHILVESSPDKWHVYWLTNDTPLAEFTARQQAIAVHLGTDPAVTDIPRVLRLPGFYHQKDAPFLTRLVEDAS